MEGGWCGRNLHRTIQHEWRCTATSVPSPYLDRLGCEGATPSLVSPHRMVRRLTSRCPSTISFLGHPFARQPSIITGTPTMVFMYIGCTCMCGECDSKYICLGKGWLVHYCGELVHVRDLRPPSDSHVLSSSRWYISSCKERITASRIPSIVSAWCVSLPIHRKSSGTYLLAITISLKLCWLFDIVRELPHCRTYWWFLYENGTSFCAFSFLLSVNG